MNLGSENVHTENQKTTQDEDSTELTPVDTTYWTPSP